MVRVRIDEAKLARKVQGLVRDAAERAANKVQERARHNIELAGRVDTGQMRDKIHVREVTTNRWRPRFSVSADTPQARFNEEGTRAHGPVSSSRLVFKPKGGNSVVYAKRVRGIEGIHFMRKAKDAARVRDYLP